MAHPDSQTELQIEAKEGEKHYSFLTRDGLVSSDTIRPEVIALLDHVSIHTNDNVLIVDGNYGTLGVICSDLTNGKTVVTETSVRAAETCNINIERNSIDNISVELTADVSSIRNEFDTAVFAPKPFTPVDTVKERIAEASTRLSTGGQFYVAGTKSNGINRFADTLSELLTDSKRLAIEGACHVYRGTKNETFEYRQYLEQNEFRASVDDYTCRFLTVPGLFSWQNLDAGTEALLQEISVPDGSRVLDCCCGYGAIGAFVGARTDCKIWATDDDIVATAYAKQNLERNGVSPEAVVAGDCTDSVANGVFDVVLSNPPTHAGSGVTKKLFSGVHEVLDKEGTAYFVANEIMEYDVKLSQEFEFDAVVVGKSEKYDIIEAVPR